MKLAITGGHLTPALEFIDYIKANQPKEQIIFLGRTHTQINQPAREQELVASRKIKFIEFNSPKLSGSPISLLLKLPQLIINIFKARKILKDNQVTGFLGFGGYLSLPVAIAAKTLRLPIVIHEQTMSLGLANQLIAFFADRVALSFPADKPLAAKYQVTGNLLRSKLVTKSIRPKWIPQTNLPILFITGGSQGSKFINELALELLPELTKDFSVIHQTGRQTDLLPLETKNYFRREWLDESELAWILQHAKICLSRSGANTVQELHFFAIPSLLIPLPYSRRHEQLKNANLLANLGGAIVLRQDQAQISHVLEALKIIIKRQNQMAIRLKETKPIQALTAAAKIFELIKTAHESR